MTRSALLWLGGGGALLLCGCGAWLLAQLRAADRMAARVRRAQGRADPAPATAGGYGTVLRHVAQVGGAIMRSGVLPATTLAQLQATLDVAGMRGANGVALFVGAKAALVLCLPLLAFVLLPRLHLERSTLMLGVAAAAVGGLLAPDYVVRKLRSRHLQRVEAGLADALDMMVICAEAGLGLEPALVRVGVELRHVHPALADELARTSHELQIVPDSRIALGNMSARTGLECLRRLGTTLIQTMQYGTPLSAALRVLAAELRLEALTRFEERAARLPVLLTLPMILFILPCVFLVVGGPAAIQVMKALG